MKQLEARIIRNVFICISSTDYMFKRRRRKMAIKNRINNRGVFAACIMATLIAIAVAATIPVFALQPVTLTLTGDTGTITKNETDILAMPSTSGDGGTRKSSGSISNYGTYVGVSVLYLCDLVGGIDEVSTIRTIDSTGSFTQDFTYEQVNDGQGFDTFNPTTGAPQEATQPLTLILAYSYNGSELSESDGPLRAVIVGPEGLATTSSLWNKQVTTIEIIPDIPEYTILAWIACLAGFTILIVFAKSRKSTHKNAHISIAAHHS
jgi:hypothetical protein